MKNLIIKIFLFLFLTAIFGCLFVGCITQKKKDRICKTCPVKESLVIKDSTWRIKYDSVLKIPVQGPKIILKDNPCASLCDSLGRVKDFFIEEKSKSGIKGFIKGNSKNNTIVFDCGEKDSLEVLLKGAREEIYKLRTEKEVKVIESKCTLEHRNFLDRICRIAILILLLFVLGKYAIKYFLKWRI